MGEQATDIARVLRELLAGKVASGSSRVWEILYQQRLIVSRGQFGKTSVTPKGRRFLADLEKSSAQVVVDEPEHQKMSTAQLVAACGKVAASMSRTANATMHALVRAASRPAPGKSGMTPGWRVRLPGSAWLPGLISYAEAEDLRSHGFLTEHVR